MIKLTLQAMDGGGMLGDTGLLHDIGSYNFLYASGWLALISVAVIVGFSLTAPAPTDEQIEGLTYGSITPEQAAENKASYGPAEIWASAGVLVLVSGIYLYFSFWLD